MLKIQHLLKKYEKGNVAINGVSLELADTGLVALVGASGAGKTTLLNLLAMNDTATDRSTVTVWSITRRIKGYCQGNSGTYIKTISL